MKQKIINKYLHLLLFSIFSTNLASQVSVVDPDIVLDLDWKIGQWQTLWQTESFQSDIVDTDVGYFVYLPPGYSESKKNYPVLIWLHGAYGRPYSATPVVKRLDAAIRNGTAPAMIVVSCLDPTGLGMWTDSKDKRLPMESIIIKELIPHIAAEYRTVNSREGRAIEGFSMGGYGAAYLGSKYAESFSSISMLGAALHTPDTFAERRQAIFNNVFDGDKQYAEMRSPWRLAKEHTNDLKNTSIRIYVGADDGLLEWNTNFHEQLNASGISHEWGVVPDSPHNLEIMMQNWQGDFFSYYSDLFKDL